jgi:hypothetical protein
MSQLLEKLSIFEEGCVSSMWVCEFCDGGWVFEDRKPMVGKTIIQEEKLINRKLRGSKIQIWLHQWKNKYWIFIR